jgi:polar amino acid transport system substrate-binding protein
MKIFDRIPRTIRVIFCFWLGSSGLVNLEAAPVSGARTTVLLTTGPDYYPLTDIRRPDGGRATRIVSAVFKSLGKDIVMDWLPWKRGYQMTKTGKYAATFPYLKTPEREREFHFSDVITKEESLLWTRSGSALNINDPATFKKAKICAGVGYASVIEETLRSAINLKDVEIFRPQNRESCILMLAAGRVDAISGLKDEILPMVEANDLTGKLTFSARPIKSVDFHLIAPKNNPASRPLIADFNKALKQLKADGTLQKLMEN